MAPTNCGNSPTDFQVPEYVDADDPGFDTEFDSDGDTDSNTSTQNFDDENQGEERDTKLRKWIDHSDAQLRELTSRFQSQYLQQPKSTQLILSQEVSQLYRSYQQHGSAARLSASIMAFLDGGDTVYRSTNHVVEEDELDAYGTKTGRKKKARKEVVERAQLRFVPLPKIGKSSPYQSEKEKRREMEQKGCLGGGKRKASDNSSYSSKRERFDGPDGGFVYSNKYGAVGERPPRDQYIAVRTRNVADGVGNDIDRAMDIDERDEGETCSMLNDASQSGSTLKSSNFADQDSTASSSAPGQNGVSFKSVSTRDDLSQVHDGLRLPTQAVLRPGITTKPPVTPIHMNMNMNKNTRTAATIPSHLYSLTTDPETQSLLMGDTPAIPFHPLADLKITIPVSSSTTSSTTNNSLLPPPPPTSIQPIISRILSLHSHAAIKFYFALMQKYTLPRKAATATVAADADAYGSPPPPPPPAALFRLAITTRLHSNLEHMFNTPSLLNHPNAFDASTRSLFRDLYDRYTPAKINSLETAVLARACRVDPESVEMWWDERNRELMPWNALRMWVEGVEKGEIERARREGWY